MLKAHTSALFLLLLFVTLFSLLNQLKAPIILYESINDESIPSSSVLVDSDRNSNLINQPC